MKIDPKNAINIYELQSRSNVSRRKNNKNESITVSVSDTLKDRIEISEKGLKFQDILAAKSNMANQIEKGAADNKVQALKDKINKGDYFISSSDIADAILKSK